MCEGEVLVYVGGGGDGVQGFLSVFLICHLTLVSSKCVKDHSTARRSPTARLSLAAASLPPTPAALTAVTLRPSHTHAPSLPPPHGHRAIPMHPTMALRASLAHPAFRCTFQLLPSR